MPRQPFVLIIRDGWGENPNPEHDAFNAVRLARTPVDDRLRATCAWTLIKTSGEDVGLPEGTMGNSEVGHQNIGAGRVVDQESVAITKSCRAGLAGNEAIAGAVGRAKASGRAVHVMGIASDAGVHGLLSHLEAVLVACRALGPPEVYVHLFTDGRDTGPFTGLGYVRWVEERCASLGVGRVASVIGRYWAMDRDHRWERVERAYACLTGLGEPVARAGSASEVVEAYYRAPARENLAGDEYVPPTVVAADGASARASRIRDGDAVIFYNYRGDRPRELCAALVFPDEAWGQVKASPDSGRRGFDRGERPRVELVTMTAYWEALAPHVRVAFPKPPKMRNIAGEWVSSLGLGQFRCAETEKYPHVTFFFNDSRDEPFAGERRENPQSPRVSTYDLKPEMAAEEVRDAVVRRVRAADAEGFMVVNFANADMVGHTGNLGAAVRACEAVDEGVGAILEAVRERGGSAIVTADHGNAEQMKDPETGAAHTAHTVYDVPLFVVTDRVVRLRGDREARGWFDPRVREARGRLADIVPTALELMGLAIPAEMTGRSLIER